MKIIKINLWNQGNERIKSFDFGRIQKYPFWPMPLHFRNASAASACRVNWPLIILAICSLSLEQNIRGAEARESDRVSNTHENVTFDLKVG